MKRQGKNFFGDGGENFSQGDAARIGRARGARCGTKTEFLWSNEGGGRNPGKPGFGW